MANLSVEPQSKIWLTKCPLEADLKNTFTFTNHEQQLAYFNGLSSTQLLASDYVYIRKDNKIRANINFDQAVYFNYLYYLNDGFTGRKSYFCFIDKCEYVNENLTDIYFHTDVFQTWYFQLTWNRCFVEREHVNSDNIGEHTLPEGLETGEFITNSTPTYIAHYSSAGGDNAGNDSYVCLCVTDFPTTSALSDTVVKCVNGVFNGCIYLVATGSTSSDVATSINNYLTWYAQAGKLDYIQSVFTIPKNLLYFNNTTQISIITVGGHAYSYVKPSDEAYRFIDDVTININTTLNGYTPKNKKLFTREFNNIVVSNQAGTDVVMAYEDFTNHTPKFTAVGSICPGCSVKLVPLNYRLLADSTTSKRSYNFGIPGPKYPICSWTGDTYTNWLTQNGVNLAIGVVGGAVIAGAAIASGGTSLGVTGMAVGGLSSIGSALASVYKHSIVPEQTSGNVSVGDVTYSDGKALFTVFPTCIRYEYAKIIDDYFSMFGYKVNSVKTPNITGRTNWNYVKTIDCNVEGDIPQEDLETIRKAMNTGVTFWHTPANIYNYSLSNNIV